MIHHIRREDAENAGIIAGAYGKESEKKMEIRLLPNTRLHLDWLKDGSLSLQVYQPGIAKDGAGYLLSAWQTLDGDELITLLRLLARQEEADAA